MVYLKTSHAVPSAHRLPPQKLDFVDFCAKSCFSFLKGASHPHEMIETAHRLGYRGLALSDDDGFCSAVRAYKAAQALKFHSIVATEIAVATGRMILVAKNLTGYQQICRLLSTEFLKQKTGAIFTVSQLSELSAEAVALLAPPRNFLKIADFMTLCRNRPLYQLVSLKGDRSSDRNIREWLTMIPPSLPRLWTWDSRFHETSRHELHEVLQAIRLNTPLSQILPSSNGEAYLKPLESLSHYKVPKQWLHDGLKLAEECQFSMSQLRYSYPKEWLPKGKTPSLFLRELCDAGAQKRFPNGMPLDICHQLEHELKIIQRLQFEDYFLTVWDIIQFARSHNILCQGRGSAANSVVCYLLEITAINPVQMNLLFERFISEERREAPDIDIDFEHERREEVIQYVYNKYGRHRAGLVATLITYRTKSALRDCGKALEIAPEMIETYSRAASWREPIFETEAFKKSLSAKGSTANNSLTPQMERWLRLSQNLKGFPRHLGQHTGGMILTHDRLDEISPLQAASMENRSCVQWDKYDIEELGLLKIDLLGLGMLTALRKSFEGLRATRGVNLELYQIPSDDSKTYSMIQAAKTLGVFQIESRAQMSMLPRLKPQNFYDLVVEVGIVRPGPIQGGMIHPYLRRRLGLEKVSYADPKLQPILEKTLGIPLFQEQVMKMAIEVAGYNAGEADALRRSMGTWKKSGELQAHAETLSRRLRERGIPSDFADQICKQILGFGEYGFPESHAASFALLTYASAYMKAHYPDVFLCSLLNSMPMGFYPFHMLTFDFQRDGGTILPVDLQYSHWDHQLEALQNSPTKQWAVRLGFRCVRNLQKSHVDSFIQQRTGGQNTRGVVDMAIFDVRERASLAMTKALDEKRNAYWKALLPTKDSLLPHEPNIPFKSLRPFESMLLDFQFMETTLSTHPAILAKQSRWRYNIPTTALTLAKQLEHSELKGRSVVVFGLLQVIQSPPTAHGMYFITLEDESGYLNLVLRPPIFQRYKDLLQSQWALLVRGRVQNDRGSISILVDHLFEPQAASTYSLAASGQTTRPSFRRSSHARASARLTDPSAQELLADAFQYEADDEAIPQNIVHASKENLS